MRSIPVPDLWQAFLQKVLAQGQEVPLLVAALVALNIATLSPFPLLRGLVTIPLALILPGTIIMFILFQKGRECDVFLHSGLSILLSMAFYSLLLLLLYTGHILFTLPSIIIAMDGCLAILLVILVVKRRKVVVAALSEANNWPTIDRRKTEMATHATMRYPVWSTMRGGVRFAAGIAGIMLVLSQAMRLLPQGVDTPFTQFYLSGSWSRLHSIIYVPPAHRLSVTVGITNETHRRQEYLVFAASGHGTSWPVRQVTLADHQSWSGALGGTLPTVPCLAHLTISLDERDHGRVSPISSLSVWATEARHLPSNCITPLSVRGQP